MNFSGGAAATFAAGTFTAATFAAGTFVVVAFAAGTFAAATFLVIVAFATRTFTTGTFLVVVTQVQVLGQGTGFQIVGLERVCTLVGSHGAGSERHAGNGTNCSNELSLLQHFNSLQQL
ncbi:MAG: hypothetical protein ACNA7E_03205 [Wenzhouxiangellaceae bacterium]